MELGTLQIQIFVSLVVVLGTAFVAFLCDFLKGSNEQLRERNIEMRVRQEEQRRFGVWEPAKLLKGIEALLKNTPALQQSAPVVAAPEPPAEATPAPTWEQPAAAAKASTWASKEELEKLAERAARIRERHEARKAVEETEFEPVAPTVLPVAVAGAMAGVMADAVEEEAVAEPVAEARVEPLVEAAAETAAETSAETVAEARVEAAPETAEAGETPPVTAEEPGSEQEPQAASAQPEAGGVFEGVETVAAEEAVEPEAAEAVEAEPVAGLQIALPHELPRVAEPGVAAVAHDEEGALEAAGEPVRMPQGQLTLVPMEAGDEAVEAEVGEIEEELGAGSEPEFLRVRVVPIDQAVKEEGVAAEEAVGAEAVAEAAPVVTEAVAEAELAEAMPVETEAPAVAPIEAEAGAEEPLAAGAAEAVPATEAATGSEAEPPAAVEELEVYGRKLIPAPEEGVVEAAAEAEMEVAGVAAWEPAPEQGEVVEAVAGMVTADEPETMAALAAGVEITSLHESIVKEEPGLPAGLHDVALLRERMKANLEFQGVAVSIGINDYEALRQKLDTASGAESMAAVERLIQSMLREPDFACRFQEDEFILLFPGEADSSAQRRLFQISEKLWDFQLRSLGHHSIMFSWGGLEVKRDSLSDAVASARERMFQTRRNRTGAIEMRKRVVNG